MFEPGCTSLTLSNAYTTSLDIPSELRHFFGPVIINPVTALKNLTRVFSIDDAPYVIQVTSQHTQGGLIRLKPPKFFIPKPSNDEPDGPNQFLRFVCSSSLNQDRGVIEKQMLESSGFSEGGTFAWECENRSHKHRSGMLCYYACIWRRESM
ncbi:hypothetical protein BofuT4_P106930.1 [Botrytis cinerea T4]|uniref:Uncharacterized protein n=1 Tax=Botryotinia fuckeliana (strain T4) TaxID=999810 RepID=G2Y6Q7_BOTF4|nr:hypothetical protein BofuT4_P106930.1 [Botrytis cinerea T4]